MKPAIAVATLLALPTPSLLFAQENGPVTIDSPAAAAEPAVPDLPIPVPAPVPPPAAGDLPPPPVAPGTPDLPPAPPVSPVTPTPATPGIEGNPAAAPNPPAASQEIQESDEGLMMTDTPLNVIFQYLAKQAGRQFFHNAKIATPEYRVTGHLNDGNPLQQMEELAFMYGLTLYTKGDTIYALSQAQLGQLPSQEFTYQLKYLRPTDIAAIKELITPILTPGTGIVNFEPKTNTVVIIDTAHRIEKAREFLRNIDQAKGQIVVETKILRVNSSAAQRTGVNWSGSLGETGTTLEITRSLNGLFGIRSNWGDGDVPFSTGVGEEFDATANVVLSPVQLRGVLRALAEGNFATQISNPTLITEDNEQGSISIIDRIPIITTTVTNSTAGTDISEEVRYKIDEQDQPISEAPDKHREIGISLVVTPTLLPDGTVRMKMRPRSAQIVEQVTGQSGNVYPRVTESMIESLSRVPDGHSLVVGGFYGEVERKDRTKIPLLGDVPLMNFFFKSKDTVKENASLVFIVTPTSYDPASRSGTSRQSSRIHRNAMLPQDHDWVDPECNPGPAHEPNLRRGVRDLRPQEAPYYPTEAELNRGSRATEPVPAASPRRSRFSNARK